MNNINGQSVRLITDYKVNVRKRARFQWPFFETGLTTCFKRVSVIGKKRRACVQRTVKMFSKLARIASDGSVAKISKSLSRALNGRTLIKGNEIVQRAAASNFTGKASASTLAGICSFMSSNNQLNQSSISFESVLDTSKFIATQKKIKV